MNSKTAVEKIMKILGLTNQSFYEAKTEQGMMVKMEGELEIGAPIYIATEEGMIPAPAGTHKLDDGTEIEVDEEGKVAKIKMGETPDAEKEMEDDKEIIKEEDMASEQAFADVKLKDGQIIRVETYNNEESLLVGRRLKKVGYDGQLSAITDGEYETESGDVLQIVGGSIQGVQSAADNNKRKSGFVEAKTYDGAVLESPTFDVGEDVMVVDGDKKTPAPDGEHEVKLKDSEGNEVKIRIITKDGKITERSNVEEMSAQMEQIAELFAQALKKFEVKIDAIATKQKELDGKFQKFSKEPAGSRVFTQKTINEETNPINSRLEAFKRLRQDMVIKN
jgi:uncharacterized protein YuzE